MAGLNLVNIHKKYAKNVTAVADFTLDIKDKEFVVFVGPSGCGKSTTLRMIAGLEEITSGELYINGLLMNDVEPKDRNIAMVFQNYALYPHMSVYDNMAFALQLRKIPKAEIKEKVNQAAAILDITDLLDRKPKALSGGERQRVAIGRAIVRAPEVFLMDEPLSNLDAKLRNQMRAELIKLRERVDTTFVYVTHDQTEAMTLGDRIVVMKDGLIQQIGGPQEVFDFPANLFVAGFIGAPQMNFFDQVWLEKTSSVYKVKLFDHEFELSPIACEKLAGNDIGNQEVILGVRPENILLQEQKGEFGIEGILDVAEIMGNEVFLHVTSYDKRMVMRLTRQEEISQYSQKGLADKSIRFTFFKDKIHIFDKETGGNLISKSTEFYEEKNRWNYV